MQRSQTMNLITIQAKVHFNNDHTADLISSLAHPVHIRVIPLIGKAYQPHIFFISGRWWCLYFKPLSADPDIIPIILCILRKMFKKFNIGHLSVVSHNMKITELISVVHNHKISACIVIKKTTHTHTDTHSRYEYNYSINSVQDDKDKETGSHFPVIQYNLWYFILICSCIDITQSLLVLS